MSFPTWRRTPRPTASASLGSVTGWPGCATKPTTATVRPTRSTATSTCPVSAEIYSANEYWVKAASLLHTQPDGSADLPDSPYARDYLVSSMQHGTGNGAAKVNCQQYQNPLSSSPVQRALFL